MSPHDFRRFVLAHELLGCGPATRSAAPAGAGATGPAPTGLFPSGLSPTGPYATARRTPPVLAGLTPAMPGGEAGQGRMV